MTTVDRLSALIRFFSELLHEFFLKSLVPVNGIYLGLKNYFRFCVIYFYKYVGI